MPGTTISRQGERHPKIGVALATYVQIGASWSERESNGCPEDGVSDTEKIRRRRWADAVVIVAGLYTLAFALWAPTAAGGPEAGREAADAVAWWWAHYIAGAMAIGSLFLALRRPGLARGLLVLAAVVLLAGLLAYGRFDRTALLALILPAGAMLLAAPFMGPMPTPEEEGMTRAERSPPPPT